MLAGNHNKRSLASMSMGKISDTSDKAVVTKTNFGRKGKTTDVRNFKKFFFIFSSISLHITIIYY